MELMMSVVFLALLFFVHWSPSTNVFVPPTNPTQLLNAGIIPCIARRSDADSYSIQLFAFSISQLYTAISKWRMKLLIEPAEILNIFAIRRCPTPPLFSARMQKKVKTAFAQTLDAFNRFAGCCFGFFFKKTEAVHLYFPCTLQGLRQNLSPSNQLHLQTHSHHTCTECDVSSRTRPHENAVLSLFNKAPLCQVLFELFTKCPTKSSL